MRYASVCSGVEAASLAWQPLGWECAWLSEIEPFPCAVLAARFPNTPNLGDMTKIHYDREKELTYVDGATAVVPGRIDLLVGGTPCQSFSVAGKREGLDGASGLAKHFVRLLEEIQPKIFVWENVPGCLSSKTNGLYDFNFLLTAFAECGYSLAWRILDAQYARVDGFPRAVPQRRRRVFAIGCLASAGIDPAEILFEPDGLLGNTPPGRVKGKGFTADVERSVRETSVIRMQCGKPGGGKGALIGDDLSHTLATGNDQTVVILPKDAKWWDGGDRAGTFGARHDSSPCADRGQNVICYNPCDTQTNRCYSEDGVFPSLSANSNGADIAETINVSSDVQRMPDKNKLQCVVCYAASGFGQKVESDVASTLSADHDDRVIGSNAALIQTFQKVSRPKGTDGLGESRGKRTAVAIALAENTIGRQPQNGGNGDGFSEELAYTQNGTGVIGVYCRATGQANAECLKDLSPTITIENDKPFVGTAASVRSLLPIECERLMGFPDNWTRIAWKGKPEEDCPDGPRYKACGNSMCVNVMRWIGLRIEQVLKGEKK